MPLSKVTAINVDAKSGGGDKRIATFEGITECPICHHALNPELLNAFYVAHDGFSGAYCTLHIMYFCVRCRRTFLAEYKGDHNHYNAELHFPRLLSVFPVTPSLEIFSEDIKLLSPTFVEIYAQASTAEAEQLLEICGSGYRRALEFLVKDYLIHKHPDDAEKIKAELLGASISRIDDHRIKTLASRSAWIGNDEVHYNKKRDDLGLDDMKRFIKAMLSYIEAELAFEEAKGISRK